MANPQKLKRGDGEMSQKNYIVFSQAMAGYMMMNGCRLIKTAPHKDTPTKNVYYFPDTSYVKEMANNYIELRKNA